MSIHYHMDGCSYKFAERRKINSWLRSVAEQEGYKLVDLGVIFCSSERLLEMNREYLGHDYYTDIITFDSSDLEDARELAGELYIDVETVADNARLYGASTPLEEMHRILLHGVLHLSGQGDKSSEDAVEMRRKENHYLAQL